MTRLFTVKQYRMDSNGKLFGPDGAGGGGGGGGGGGSGSSRPRKKLKASSNGSNAKKGGKEGGPKGRGAAAKKTGPMDKWARG